MSSEASVLSSVTRALAMPIFGALMVCIIAHPISAFAEPLDNSSPFELVRQRAHALSQQAYSEPAAIELTGSPKTYDGYRQIAFDPERARWRGSPEGFEVHLLPLGWLFEHDVKIWLIERGEIRSVGATTADFIDGRKATQNRSNNPRPVPLSGFRINWPLNDKTKSDELIVFQGGSYFRALAAGQRYGLSGRALAMGTASQEGEEFPLFREFWIEKPTRSSRTITILGLLDSPSTSGAYRFLLRPGSTTRIDVEAMLYPRRKIETIGIAPLTSMFFVGPIDRNRVRDFRPQVHDSDGLAILNGKNERLWRPLANPSALQVSSFMDSENKGFGLIQRERSFPRYEDLEARYDLRPSAWVEPLSDFGKGRVMLVEIPTDKEIHDNIVAFWRPNAPLEAGKEYHFRYRLHWREDAPTKELGLHVESTRAGAAHFGKGEGKNLLFVVDYIGVRNEGKGKVPRIGKLPPASVTSSQGRVQNVVARENTKTGGLRVSFEFNPQGAKVAELRLDLLGAPSEQAETWLYRWTEER